MTVSATSEVHFDPYDVELNADPYPMFRRLREEAPLYYNAQHDFYALSRFADVNKALVDHDTFSSARGAILELIKANMAVEPEPRLAPVDDWGGKFQVTQEQILRNDVNYIDQQTTQLSNTIARKLDTRAVAPLQAAVIGSVAPAAGWDDLVMVGPLDQTPRAPTGPPGTSPKRRNWPTSKNSASFTTPS